MHRGKHRGDVNRIRMAGRSTGGRDIFHGRQQPIGFDMWEADTQCIRQTLGGMSVYLGGGDVLLEPGGETVSGLLHPRRVVGHVPAGNVARLT